MNIEDFEIKIKKYDEKKKVVYVNIIVHQELELRGFVARFCETKYSNGIPIWFVKPPSVKGRNNKSFYIVYLKNPTLWQLLEKKITDSAKEYTNLL